MDRIVLAYSGGLDTSVAIPWLAEKYHAEVVTITMDLGQGRELEEIRDRALALGAKRAHVIDAREEFARDFILPALAAGAIYEGRYPLASALGRPLLAKHLVNIAEIEGASAIAHGCTGKGNGQIRIEVSARALGPSILMLAPVREAKLSRPEKIAFARERGIPVPVTIEQPYSIDMNLWGRSIDCGSLEDPWQEPPEEIFQLTRPPAEAPDRSASVEIAFECGVPSAINGVAMSPVELITSLDTIAGAHGVGRIDMIENRLVGIKSREIYEAPAAVVLHAAHAELQRFVIPRDLDRIASDLSVKYADLVYNGFWYTPAREAIDAFVAKVQEKVTGAVRLKLFKGSCQLVGRESPFALYERDLSTYAEGDTFDHSAAAGFAKLWGMPVEVAARRAKRLTNAPVGQK